MKRKEMRITGGWTFYLGGVLLAVAVLTAGFWHPEARVQAQGGPSLPVYKVDPFWPKPLATVKDAKGVTRYPTTGMVGGGCLDLHENYVTLNRSYLPGSLLPNVEGPTAIGAAPVVIYNTAGDVVGSWGDTSLDDKGKTKVLPQSVHGCFVDYQDNIWMGGTGDGIVQKYSHDGKLLLQIGERGHCDGPQGLSKDAVLSYSTCGSPGNNTSHTLLNQPADIWVDPNPDPVTGQRGSVYIADGYGNFRVVVFDSAGKYLRQWGSRGNGPGQFGSPTGDGGVGHPHCVWPSNDGLLWTCDRNNNRLEIFDKVGNLKRTIDIAPQEHNGLTLSHQAATWIAFSPDPAQTFVYVTDLDSARIWVVNTKSGQIVGQMGRPGHLAGEFIYPHSVSIDSKGNMYVSETVNGRRSQKFLRQ